MAAGDTSVVANPGVGGSAFKMDADAGGILTPYSKVMWGPSAVQNEVDDAVGKLLPVKAYLAPATTGGCSKYHAVAAASTNAANIKASAGQVFSVRVFNNAAYPIYVKLHNTAGVPTAGAGVVETIGVQAGTHVNHVLPPGSAFSTGIGITIVKGITDADATAVALSDGVVDVHYA